MWSGFPIRRSGVLMPISDLTFPPAARDQRILEMFSAVARHMGVGNHGNLKNGDTPLTIDQLLACDGILPAMLLEADRHSRTALGLSLEPSFVCSAGPLNVAVCSFGPAPSAYILACLTNSLRHMETKLGFNVSALLQSWKAPCHEAALRHRLKLDQAPQEQFIHISSLDAEARQTEANPTSPPFFGGFSSPIPAGNIEYPSLTSFDVLDHQG